MGEVMVSDVLDGQAEWSDKVQGDLFDGIPPGSDP